MYLRILLWFELWAKTHRWVWFIIQLWATACCSFTSGGRLWLPILCAQGCCVLLANRGKYFQTKFRTETRNGKNTKHKYQIYCQDLKLKSIDCEFLKSITALQNIHTKGLDKLVVFEAQNSYCMHPLEWDSTGLRSTWLQNRYTCYNLIYKCTVCIFWKL